MSRFVDLSHDIHDGMDPYPGLPTPRIGAHLDHDSSRDNYEDAEFFLGKVDMPGNVGTYIDAPFHRFRDREDLAQVPLARIAGLKACVVSSGGRSREISPSLPDDDLSGMAVLIRSGWDERWGTEGYWEPGPFLAERFASEMVERGVGLVGVDFSNVDDTTTRRRPVHTELLRAGVLIVEHLRGLDEVPTHGFRFFAPVISLRGGASFPVRAFAEVPEGA